jgi:ribose 5-phosphate isomerase A
MLTAVSSQEHAKEQAGRYAAGYVVDGMKVGLGTGSTVHWTIVELAARAAGEEGPDQPGGKLDIVCTATSVRTHGLAVSLGLDVVAPDELGTLDIAIDGADEVDRACNLTKGGGGAHTREKIVAAMADRFVVVADESKLVERLGPFGTPLEVLDFAPVVTAAAVLALGATSVVPKEGRSDNGNLLLDARFGEIPDPVALAAALSAVPGVVGHGIFPAELVDLVVVAGPDGIRELTPSRDR